ncbi:MAG: polysaccharide deacetylase family protein [Bacteroidia bacterium]
MVPAHMPSIITSLFPRWTWHMPRTERVLYLTFDDGPSPGITDWVLEQLAAYQARATFFSIGDKVLRYPETLLKVQAAGHAIGNHTQHHLNLWKTPLTTYLVDKDQCQEALRDVLGREVKLFRPPYGKMTPRAARRILPQHEIVMWDVIAGDYDQQIDPDRVTQNVLRHAREGSIVVFHDSEKCERRMRHALPVVLEHFASKGFEFRSLE